MTYILHGNGIDERDREMIQNRMVDYDKQSGPRVGDWVDFDNGQGARQRISYLWPDGAQTSKGGSFYLGAPRNGRRGFAYVSFSGQLDPAVPLDTLTPTNETRSGSVWVFHHDYWIAGGGVDAQVNFRVFRCSRKGPNE